MANQKTVLKCMQAAMDASKTGRVEEGSLAALKRRAGAGHMRTPCFIDLLSQLKTKGRLRRYGVSGAPYFFQG